MPIETTAYKCDHCTKLFQTSSGTKTHERFCMNNPSNQYKCFGCAHLVTIDLTVEKHTPATGFNGEQFTDVNVSNFTDFYCKMFNKHLKTIRLQPLKAAQFPWPLELMRIECDQYRLGGNEQLFRKCTVIRHGNEKLSGTIDLASLEE